MAPSTFKQSEPVDCDVPSRNRRVTLTRAICVAVIFASAVVVFRSLPFDQAMAALKDWISGLGFYGPVVMVLVYVVATVLFVPGTILTLASGAIFGLGIGFVTVSIGSTLGASAAFLIARYLARDRFAKMAKDNRRFGAIDRAIGEGGWKIVGLLRLSPAIPFNVQNYLYGLTPVAFWPYAITSWIAMIPGTFLYVYLGHITGAAIGTDRKRSPAEWAMLAIGLVATIIVTIYVTRLANRKLKDQMSDEPSSPTAEAQVTTSHESPKTDDRRTLWLAIAAILAAVSASLIYSNAETIASTFAQ